MKQKYTKKKYTKKRYKKKKKLIKKKGKRSTKNKRTKNKRTNSQLGGRQCPREYPTCKWDGWCYDEEERDNESDNVGASGGKWCISSYKFSEEEEESRRRRRSLGLPYMATDEECDLAERARERRRISGLPYTATDEECDAREDLLERIKDISTSAPPGGPIHLGSYMPVSSTICHNDPIFIGKVIPFKNDDRIRCAKCDTVIHHLGQDMNVIQCPNCKIHLTSSLNETTDLIKKCEGVWPPAPAPWKCEEAFWDKGSSTALLRNDRGDYIAKIPEKYRNKEYYFINKKTGKTAWELT